MATKSHKILTFAEVSAMTQTVRVQTFADRDRTLRRAFSELGKLYAFISLSLVGKQSMFSVLTKAGVRKGTISNASYAADAFELVKTKHITEAQYDNLTFQDCVNLRKVRALGIDKLKAAMASKIISDELECFAEHGMSLAEKKQKDEVKAAIEASKPPVTPVAPVIPAQVENTIPAPVAPLAAQEVTLSASAPGTIPTTKADPENVVPFPEADPRTSETENLAAAMKLIDEVEKILNVLENPLPVIVRIKVLMGQKPEQIANVA